MSEYILKLLAGAAIQQLLSTALPTALTSSITPKNPNLFLVGDKQINAKNAEEALKLNKDSFFSRYNFSDLLKKEISDQIDLLSNNIINKNITKYDGKFEIKNVQNSGLDLRSGGPGEIAAWYTAKVLASMPQYVEPTVATPATTAESNSGATLLAATTTQPTETTKPNLPEGVSIDENGAITLPDGSKYIDGKFYQLAPGAEWDKDGNMVTKASKVPIAGKDNLGFFAYDAQHRKRYYDESTGGYTGFGVPEAPPQVLKPVLTTDVPGAIMTTRGLVTKANKVPLLKDRRGQYFARNNGFAWYYNPLSGHYDRRDTDYERQLAGQRVVTGEGSGKLSASDELRFGAIGADVVGLASSMLPGAGTITAGGAGLTSMGLDMVADMLDPSVSKWEVVKNAGINTALAGLGMIPGGKSATILSKAVRYIPRVIGLASAAGVVLNPQVRGSLAKMSQAATDGGTTKLNVNDWKNILYAFQSALGVTSGVRARINHARFKGAYEAPERGKLVIKTNKFKVAAKTADKKATKIILNKDLVDHIHLAGKSGGQKAAQEAFEASLPEEYKNKGLKLDSNYKTGLIKKHTSSKSLLAEQVTERLGSLDYTRQLALKAIYDKKYKSKWSDWQLYKRNRDRLTSLDESSLGQTLGHPINFIRGKITELFNPHAARDKAREKFRLEHMSLKEEPVTKATPTTETTPTTTTPTTTTPTTTTPTGAPTKKSFLEHSIPKNFSMSRKQIEIVVNKKINEGYAKNKDYFGSDEGKDFTNLKRLLHKSHRTEKENKDIQKYISTYKLDKELLNSKSTLNSAKESAKEAKAATKTTTTKKNGGKLLFVLEMHRNGGLLIKAKSGVKTKENTTLNSYSGVKFTNGNGADWNNQIFKQYKDKILLNIATYGVDYVNWLNNMLHNHSVLYNKANQSGDWQTNAYYDPSVKDYQVLYDRRTGQSELNGFNLLGILSAEKNNRYNISGKKRTSGDWGANGNDFKADGLYSAITDDRRLLGRKGDFDENSQDYKDFKNKLNTTGYDFYLDPTDNYYKLKPLNSLSQTAENTGITGLLGETEPTDKKSFLDQMAKGLYSPKLIGLSRLIGDIQSTNNRTREYASRLTVPLAETYHVYSPVHGDYATQQYYNSLGNQYQSLARKNISSNSDINNAALLEAYTKAAELGQKGNLVNNEMIAKTQALAESNAANNLARDNLVANANAESLSKYNNSLNDIIAMKDKANRDSIDYYLTDIEKQLKTDYYKKLALQDQFTYLAAGDPNYDAASDPILLDYQAKYNAAKTDAERTNIAKAAANYHKIAQESYRLNYLAKLAKLRGVNYDQGPWTPPISYYGDEDSTTNSSLDEIPTNVFSAKHGTDTGIFLSEEVKAREKDNDRFIKSIIALMNNSNAIIKGLRLPDYKMPKLKLKN